MTMIEASFTGFLRTIAIIILVYYALKFLLRIFAPVLVQHVVKKAEQNIFQQQQQRQQQQQQYQQQRMEDDKKADNKKVGEYIDYEELD